MGLLSSILGEAAGIGAKNAEYSRLNEVQQGIVDMMDEASDPLMRDQIVNFAIEQIPLMGSAAVGGGAIIQLHEQGIQALADAEAPGFKAESIELPSGQVVQVYIDASTLTDIDPETGQGKFPTIYIRGDKNPGRDQDLSARDQRFLDDRVDELQRQAQREVIDEWNPRTGFQNYENKVLNALEEQLSELEVSSLELESSTTTYGRSAGDPSLIQQAAAFGVQIANAAIPDVANTNVTPVMAPPTLTA